VTGTHAPRGLIAIVAVVIAVLASGCHWTIARFDAANTGFNRFETTIDASNVDDLSEQWTTPALGDNPTVPIVVGSRSEQLG
jgi:hypothetical protein